MNVLHLDGITKRFGALTANDDVTLELKEGEILALLGENGAGKTTLMNILFGHYAADEGRVEVFGQELPPGRPRAAIEAGVGMVHQHFTLAGNLTVLDNVMLGSEPLLRLRSRRAEGRARLMALSEQFGLPVKPEARVASLSVGERQRVEILKALYRDARILILDEPTAVLARPEAQRLFETLRGMTGQGLSIIFISHKLNEVMAASDRVAVLARRAEGGGTQDGRDLGGGTGGTDGRPPRDPAEAAGAPDRRAASDGRGRDRASRRQADAGRRVLHRACGRDPRDRRRLRQRAGGAGGASVGWRHRAGAADTGGARDRRAGPRAFIAEGSAVSPRIAMPRAWWASFRSGRTACWSG
jgi:ABC-type multidrug transport system ATPase subunit